MYFEIETMKIIIDWECQKILHESTLSFIGESKVHFAHINILEKLLTSQVDVINSMWAFCIKSNSCLFFMD